MEEAFLTILQGLKRKYPHNKAECMNILMPLYNACFDEDKWITVHPPHGNKSDKGIPVKINEHGTIKAGMGGKFNGENIRNINIQNNTISENKISYFPKSIAGVKQGKTMSFAQADSGNVNPNKYRTNCQSCVVCFEMRLRGYNVETLPNTIDSALEKLSYDYLSAWIDPATGKKPAPLISAKSKLDLFLSLHDKLKEGERYILQNSWKRKENNVYIGHIVNIYKIDNEIVIYDPQRNEIYTRTSLRDIYFDKINYKFPVEVTRIDNLFFNPQYIDSIVKESYTTKQEDL